MRKLGKIKAGCLLQIESGEYSDYQVDGFFVVLQDFDLDSEINKVEGLEKEFSFGAKEKLIASLIRHGLLLELDPYVLYLPNFQYKGFYREVMFMRESTKSSE